MGRITRLRTLANVGRVYGLTGADHPPEDIGTESPVTIVNDVSRWSELAQPDATPKLVVASTGVIPTAAGTFYSDFTLGTDAWENDTSGSPAQPNTEGTWLWLTGIEVWVNAPGSYSAARVAVNRAAQRSGASGYGNIYEEIAFSSGFGQIWSGVNSWTSPTYYRELPFGPMLWGDAIGIKIVSTASDAGAGLYARFLVLPYGVGPNGRR